MNKPQLSAEMEKRFDDRFPKNKFGARINIYYSEHPITGETQYLECSGQVKHFLATALEEEREKVLSEVDGWLVDEFTEEDEWICPKCGNTVGEGYYCRNDRSKPVKETRKWEDGWQEAKNVLRAELRAKLNQLKGTDAG